MLPGPFPASLIPGARQLQQAWGALRMRARLPMRRLACARRAPWRCGLSGRDRHGGAGAVGAAGGAAGGLVPPAAERVPAPR